MKRKSNKIYSKSASLNNNLIKVRFPWDLSYLTEIKAIQGRKFNSKEKYWNIPLTLGNCFTLKKLKYIFKEDLKKWANKEYARQKGLKENNFEIPGLKLEMFHYQKEGTFFLEKNKGRGLIADEMGLGKTVQALAYLQLHPELFPAIIICPATLKLNWRKEVFKWLTCTKNVQIVNGVKDNNINADIIICNYEIIPNKEEIIYNKDGVAIIDGRTKKPKLKEIHYTGQLNRLQDLKAKVLIIDEVHYLKNSSTKRTKAIKKLNTGIPHVITLSGTPIESRPIEIYNTVQLVDRNLFPSEWKFKHRYCDPKHNGFGWSFKGATNIKELHEILTKNVMIRRKKIDVLKDLPDKIYSFVPFEIDNRKEYEQAEDNFKQYVRNSIENDLKNKLQGFMTEWGIDSIDFQSHTLERLKEEKAKKATPIAQIEVLKQLAVKGKLKGIVDWIYNFLESGEKLVVFCEHIFTIDFLMKEFGKIAVKIDGSVSHKNRDKAVEAFQNNNKIKLFIGNAAAETGLTLTAASHVAVAEFPWTPGKLNQRIDRCHRIGQKNTVNISYLVASETIEEQIAIILDKKMKVISEVLDGVEMDSENLLQTLIKKYNYEKG